MFSYASEDDADVLAIYSAVQTDLEGVDIWIDKAKMVGGGDLLAMIAKAIDNSEKVFLFLSEVTLQKPWVQRELKKSLMREINEGVDLIVPVMLGGFDTLPAWTEDKLWIRPSGMDRAQLVAEFKAAIEGTREFDLGAGSKHVTVTVEPMPGVPHAAAVVFSASGFAASFSCRIPTAVPIRQNMIGVGRPGESNVFGANTQMVEDRSTEREFNRSFQSPMIEPGKPITVILVFDEGVDGVGAITTA